MFYSVSLAAKVREDSKDETYFPDKDQTYFPEARGVSVIPTCAHIDNIHCGLEFVKTVNPPWKLHTGDICIKFVTYIKCPCNLNIIRYVQIYNLEGYGVFVHVLSILFQILR